MSNTLKRCKPLTSLPLTAGLTDRLVQITERPPAQTYIMEGADDALRFETAEALAAGLLCHDPKDGACGRCPSCRYMEAGTHADCRFLPEERSDKRIPVDTVRREVMADVIMAPQLGTRKVYVIAGDKLNEQGQNALLKTLEEPPAGVFFLVTAPKAEHLLPTLRSRSTVISLLRKGELSGDNSGLAAATPEEAADYAAKQAKIRNFVLRLPARTIAQLLTDDLKWLEQFKEDPELFHSRAKLVLRDLLVLAAGQSEALSEAADRSLYSGHLRQHRPSTNALAKQSEVLDTWLQRLRGNANFEINSCALLLAWRKEYPYG